LTWLSKSLQLQHPGEKLQRNAQRLDELEQRLNKSIHQTFAQLHQRLAMKSQKLQQFQPTVQILYHQQQLTYCQQRLKRAMQLKLLALKQRQAGISHTLQAVSPLATLERGYAIVQEHQSQRIVKSIQQLAENDFLDTRLSDGRIVSQIKSIIQD
jgi:exodeoxyribonuclease VII large subunit